MRRTSNFAGVEGEEGPDYRQVAASDAACNRSRRRAVRHLNGIVATRAASFAFCAAAKSYGHDAERHACEAAKRQLTLTAVRPVRRHAFLSRTSNFAGVEGKEGADYPQVPTRDAACNRGNRGTVRRAVRHLKVIAALRSGDERMTQHRTTSS